MLFKYVVSGSICAIFFVGIFKLDVTIVNKYGKTVEIITTEPSLIRFTIPAGGRYKINRRYSTLQPQIYITAFDGVSFVPIKIDGKDSVNVSPTITEIKHIYHVSSGGSYIELAWGSVENLVRD